MKKIALINPPYRVVRHTLSPSFPLGLGYIKKVCDNNGLLCDLYDFSASTKSDDELIKNIILCHMTLLESVVILYFLQTL